MYSKAGRSDILSTQCRQPYTEDGDWDFGERRNDTKEVLLDSIKKDGLIMHPSLPGVSLEP